MQVKLVLTLPACPLPASGTVPWPPAYSSCSTCLVYEGNVIIQRLRRCSFTSSFCYVVKHLNHISASLINGELARYTSPWTLSRSPHKSSH